MSVIASSVGAPTGPVVSGLTNSPLAAAAAPTRVRVLRQGWVYKHGPFYRPWQLRWFKLMQPEPAGHASVYPVLAIYHQRDHAATAQPRTALTLSAIEIEVPLEPVRRSILDRGQLFPFVIVHHGRKYSFATAHRKEREEWIHLIQSVTGSSRSPKPIDALPAVELEDQSVMDPSMAVAAYYPTVAPQKEAVLDSVLLHPQALSICNEEVLSATELNELSRSQHDSKSGRAIHPLSPALRQLSEHEPWNDMYQRLVTQPCDSTAAQVQKDVRMCELIGQFREVAETLGRQIIDEYHKTDARPMDDLAESETWIKGHLVFELVGNNPSHDDIGQEAAIRKAAHELLSINAINHVDSDLHTPLMCILDYKGFRLVCYALMPLDNQSTLVLDLANDIKSLVDVTALEKLSESCAPLNLKEHAVLVASHDEEPRAVQVRGAATVAVHYCRQYDHYYALNLHELFPVDQPKQDRPRIDSMRRLRPEYLAQYKHALSSDAFRAAAAGNAVDDATAADDLDAVYAARYLRENHIPQFVKQLDALQLLPYDARGLAAAMHRAGINVRYLGLVTKYTKLPYVKELCLIEMVARAVKVVWGHVMRRATLDFRRIEATKVDHEHVRITIDLFNQVLGADEKLWEEMLKPAIQRKFNFVMSLDVFRALQRPALFLSLQYHCGVGLIDSTTFDFTTAEPLSTGDFVRFHVKVKPLVPAATGLARLTLDEQRYTYEFARHLSMLGPRSKLAVNDMTAAKFNQLVAHYNAVGRYQEAATYGQAALNLSTKNQAGVALVYLNLCETAFMQEYLRRNHGKDKSKGKDQAPTPAESDESLPIPPNESNETLVGTPRAADFLQLALDVIAFHWGSDHPLVIDVHGRMVHLLYKVHATARALDQHALAMRTCYRILGKTHLVTARHLLKAGHMLLDARRGDEAARQLTEALTLFSALASDGDMACEKACAHAHALLAACLHVRGDMDAARKHAGAAKTLRERLYGPLHALTCDSYAQVAHLALASLHGGSSAQDPLVAANLAADPGAAGQDAAVFVTNQGKQALAVAIECYQKIFKYHRHHRGGARPTSVSDVYSVSTSRLSRVGPQPLTANTSTASLSLADMSGTAVGRATGRPNLPTALTALAVDGGSSAALPAATVNSVVESRGPGSAGADLDSADGGRGVFLRHRDLVVCAPEGKNALLLALTRTILVLKFRTLVPDQLGQVRAARQRVAKAPALQVRDVMVRLVGLTPVVFLEDCLARISDGDREAFEELVLVVQLVDRDQVNAAASPAPATYRASATKSLEGTAWAMATESAELGQGDVESALST
ncbi:hypothetical protein AMAG_08823 [Allomyces macrogynus ATCC 38327]|uniref:PH domain-containing protein n=1 Tax=Allomyces macrogynus (strain ATCC 38327) TaxID=578462 RepID=A0A0L0SMX8_ALLM3|nr:hypothetical protein AMAG_08823 [Allomyces macrogynus ATCC 38327]|eukprot:KNE63740.1 hypothetical protein AMAG_08823 [Allomyces macrogynus ATCC 38327]